MANKRKFRVWIGQVNQCYVDVDAKDLDDAYQKGYKKWKRDYAHSQVTYAETIDDTEGA
jgi:hypothetical protein